MEFSVCKGHMALEQRGQLVAQREISDHSYKWEQLLRALLLGNLTQAGHPENK